MKKKKPFVALNINIPLSVNEKINQAMEETGLNKTSVVILALSQYFKTNDSIDVLQNIIDIYKKEDISKK